MLVNSGSKFKKDDTVSLKNILGEEMVATYVSEDETTYTVKDVHALGMGEKGLQFMPCIMSGDVSGETTIQRIHYLWVVPAKKEIEAAYSQTVTGIAVPAKPSIIV